MEARQCGDFNLPCITNERMFDTPGQHDFPLIHNLARVPRELHGVSAGGQETGDSRIPATVATCLSQMIPSRAEVVSRDAARWLTVTSALTGRRCMEPRESILKISDAMNAAVIGQQDVVERMLIALLANGHVLMEGLPGTAKTRSVKTLSQLVDSEFSRIQFTPDLLPSDVSGSEIYREQNATFEFQQGPIFGNLILADEINRAPAKVQAALLEAMEERQVTVAGQTHRLPELFLVLATQNPIEQEGTYPLPEAQMDRFLLYVRVDYPAGDKEAAILKLVRGEKSGQATAPPPQIEQQVVFEARKQVNAVHVAEAAEQYMVDLVLATRLPQKYEGNLPKWIRLGASPRGTIALDAAARAHAWLAGQDFVSPDNIRAVAPACLAHRIHLTYEAEAAGVTRSEVIDELLKNVVPV
jgi:MoxR-like ATPase